MAENDPRDYYADLGISSDATVDAIKSAFHKLAIQHHPDKKGPNDTGDASEFRKVREAYETLSDAQARAAYDRTYQWKKPSYPFACTASTKSPANVFRGEERRKASKQRSNSTQSFTPTEYSDYTFTSRSTPFSSSTRRGSSSTNHFRSSSTPQAPQRPKAHGVEVIMSDHPAGQQINCPFKVEEWNKQSGTDWCIFCLTQGQDISRCPGCEAAACPACLKLVAQGGKQNDGSKRPNTFGYYYSGG